MTDHVHVDRNDSALHLRLNRPERRNAITVAMYEALADAIEGAADDPSIRLIALSGEGQDFTAGNDLADFMADMPQDGSDVPVWRLLRALARNPLPLVASVKGNAVGIGTTILLHCDLVVAEEDTRFHMPFVDLGLVPEAASSLLMPQLAGRRAAARHLLLGEPFSAAQALDMGLVSHVVASGTSDEERRRICQQLLAKPAEALRLTQNLLRASPDREAVLGRMELENGHFAERLRSAEVKKAIADFFERRR